MIVPPCPPPCLFSPSRRCHGCATSLFSLLFFLSSCSSFRCSCLHPHRLLFSFPGGLPFRGDLYNVIFLKGKKQLTGTLPFPSNFSWSEPWQILLLLFAIKNNGSCKCMWFECSKKLSILVHAAFSHMQIAHHSYSDIVVEIGEGR